MSKQYNSATVADWYWTAEDGRVFSSARAQTVKASDAAFKAWLADETRPTPWPRDEAGEQTDAALQDVLTPYGLAGPEGAVVPDGPTLADWRVALLLWRRLDDVTKRVAALVGSAKPAEAALGGIAQQQLEYSNNVSRTRLMAIHDAFGFSEAEVDESLWRADRVAKGDLSGTWPLPKTA